ncbi:hypothetical protein Ae717Ps2_6620 [Pseudonocardia sp. Ae717_Ps2]|uniref:hypothetical protein n=1 Tax=Pseudonocardia sp. Ae717_Ps2 TaxID=1885573 RepID=UPI00094B127B|nr:hypothetical protein [Pseudonocardia sp. Ae717_Ps2]OLM28281.1 hypothetical protein Ae717Ps2_6620 [Pseudonocardia sp. Ae717_Ps2]
MGATSSTASAVSTAVRAEDLVCPGCGSTAVPEPPIQWPAAAGQAPEFSHRDGSVLCPDARGRITEPVEIDPAAGIGEWRYELTEAGQRAVAAGCRS